MNRFKRCRNCAEVIHTNSPWLCAVCWRPTLIGSVISAVAAWLVTTILDAVLRVH